MDAEARWFYAVGLTALMLGFFGLILKAAGANVPTWAVPLLLLIVLMGVIAVGLGQRRFRERYKAWRAGRPKPWPAGWKMEPPSKEK